MTKIKLWVIAGVMGAASVAAIPAINAHADYPPGTAFQVHLIPTGQPHIYTIQVQGATPGCTFRIVSGKVHANTPVLSDGTATIPSFDVGTKTGNRPIIAKTISCHKKETYSTHVTTTTNQIKGPSSAKQGEKITFKALGWNPDSKVVITLSTTQKGVVKTKALKPNSTGNVFWKITAPKPGTYAVTFRQDGPPPVSSSYTMTIHPKKH